MDTVQVMAASAPTNGASVAHHQGGGPKAAPCCDKARLGCSKACPTACFTSIAGLAALSSVVIREGRSTFDQPAFKTLGSREPAGPDHPPKSTT
ncbi:hypothetical protein [Caulobacter sp. LjRoot300]|uniref:hypothetical protein n=1 Tax=Caulobacter sp. LjRoot300 TaxID=3342321 RepID=UPI003ED07C55